MSKERTGNLSFLGHPMRLCLFFAANPDARLTSIDVAEMLGIQARGVGATMRGALIAGLVDRESGAGREHSVYFAGPALLESIAMRKPPEDVEIAQVIRPAGTWERKAQGLAPATWLGAMA